MTVLTLSQVSQSYGHRKVLRQIDFELQSREIAVLTGVNGVGKTTLLKVMSGLLKPDCGEIKREGRVSLFLPEGYLYEDLTLAENFQLYRDLDGGDPEWTQDVASRLNLTHLLHERVRYLSRGQCARGALCRAFLMRAAYYLLDEPWSGLDAESSERLLKSLVHFREMGKAILVATHQPDLLSGIANRFAKLENGRLALG